MHLLRLVPFSLLAVFMLVASSGGLPAIAQADPWYKDHPRVAKPTGFQSGANVVLYSTPPDFTDKVDTLLDHLVDVGYNSVTLAMPIYTDGYPHSWTSNVVFYDEENAPNASQIIYFGQAARARGFGAINLRVHMDEDTFKKETDLYGGVFRWRGNVQPTSPAEWFSTYKEVMLHYAGIAKQGGYTALSLGVELNTMEPYTDQWSDLISQVRSVFQGELTYASNWNPTYGVPKFSNQLDYNSLDAYYELKLNAGASVSQLVRALHEYLDVSPFPLSHTAFAEVGMVPQAGGYRKPYVWDSTEGLNHTDRANYIQAICQVALEYNLVGVSWWNYELTPVPDDSYTGFNLYDAPEEATIQGCNQSTWASVMGAN